MPNSEVKLGYAVNKNDPELLSIINKALKAIPTTEIGDILTNWGANPDIHANANHLNPTEQHWLSTHRRLKYCFNPHKKPYDYIEDGAHQGIFADYLALFGDKLNIHWQAVPTANWNDAVEAARQRHCDVISGAIKTPELEQFFDFSTPYFEITPVLLAKANKPFVKGIEEVRAHPIGVLRNSPLEALLRRDFPEMHLIAVEAEHITDLLESGEVYAFVTSLEHAARHIDEKLYNYRIIAKLDYSQPISLAIRNDWPLLRAILDKAVRTVTQAEHNTIKAKWTTHRLTQRVDYSLLFQVVGGAMLILLFVMISNRRMAREIQQRIQVEEQLRKLSRAVEQSHSTIVITDLDGTIEFVNPAFTRITGYTQAEVIGQNPRILQSGEHALPFYQNMWATLTQGEVWQGELHNKRKNGDMYWEFATISSIKNQAGEITHYVAIKEDISARREAEAKVRESTERLQKIAARVPGLVFQFEMRADGSIAFPYASEAMRDIYGVDPDSVKKDATPVIDNIHPADREEVMVSIQRSAETLMPWQQEYRILFADGRQRWLLGNSVPERRQDGCVLWHGFITDITERKKAEQNLRENEAKLRNLYELSPLGIALTDIQGRFLEFNNAFVDICGCSAEELEKLNYWTLIQQDEDAAQTSMQLQTLQSQGRCGPYEKTYTRKDGAQVPVRLNAMLMSSQDGSAYIWTLLEDIRAQKQHEAELQQARDAAEAANYAKSAFLANMSHELRTPLNAILGFAQILHQLDDLKPEYRSHVDNIHRGGQYLLTLINDVLDLAKVEAGYIELYPQEVIIDTFFRDLLEMFRLRAEKKNIRFEFIASQPLPFSMTIDPKRLRQVLIATAGRVLPRISTKKFSKRLRKLAKIAIRRKEPA